MTSLIHKIHSGADCINHYWEKSRKPACCHANGVSEPGTCLSMLCVAGGVPPLCIHFVRQGEGEGFLDYGVGKTGIFFLFLFQWGIGVFTQLMPLTCINPKVLCGCVSVCTCLAIKPLSSGN